MPVTEPSGSDPVPRSSKRTSRIVTAALTVALVGSYATAAISISKTNAGTHNLRIWLTGYTWQDNTPPNTAIISHPVLHQSAGGTGTFADPITVAVPGDRDHMTDPPGTRFYLPTVQRYVIVEDNGAGPIPPGDDTHLDLWIDGRDGTEDNTSACAEQITGKRVPAEINPPDNRPVSAGPLYANHSCNAPQLPAANK